MGFSEEWVKRELETTLYYEYQGDVNLIMGLTLFLLIVRSIQSKLIVIWNFVFLAKLLNLLGVTKESPMFFHCLTKLGFHYET